MPGLGSYYGVDHGALRGPLRQDFYPDAPDGPLTHIPGSTTWVRTFHEATGWWKALSKDAGSAGRSAPDRVSIDGPRLTGTVRVDTAQADTSTPVRFFQESGMADVTLWGGAACRESAAPTTALGPGYTVTWTMGADDWGVQEVYPFADGGPVVHDIEIAWNSAAVAGWFRADRDLLALWDKLGLPSKAEATAGAAVAPAPALAAATAPVAVSGDAGRTGDPVWTGGWLALLALGTTALLAAGGWFGIRWRRHGQPIPDRDNPPGDAG
ncbi:MAG: hypothetical protein L0Y54_17880 [Sporichthyaceae bacterium]|nr:hypothetical protein [Sporichthyaceae bacterium]